MSHIDFNSKNNDRIGNSNRDVEFEVLQIKKIFPDANTEDFFILPSGNRGIRLVFQTNGNDYNDEFEVLIEFLYDYPNSAPSVLIIRPNISNTPHTLYNKQMCYVNTRIDWNTSFTAYDVLIMIQTWIYAYCKWRSSGVWDWYQDEEYIPSPPPISEFNNINNKKERNQTPTCYRDPLSNYYSTLSQSDDNTLEYGRTQVEESIDNNFEINQNTIINDTNNNSNSEYGRVPVDDNIDKSESPNTIGRIIFATIFSLMFIAYNHWTTLVVLPFFALLFISSKSRTVVFIVLSLIIIFTSSWSFVIVPLFGLLYTSKKKYQIAISTVIILFWIVLAIIGYNIIDIKIFG